MGSIPSVVKDFFPFLLFSPLFISLHLFLFLFIILMGEDMYLYFFLLYFTRALPSRDQWLINLMSFINKPYIRVLLSIFSLHLLFILLYLSVYIMF